MATAEHAVLTLRVDEVLAAVRAEVLRAMTKHPTHTPSPHHHFAVLQEEVDEVWDEVKRDDGPKARAEMVQVGAMAVRFILEARYPKEDKPTPAPLGGIAL